MKHLLVLLAFVCAINAAKFKFSLTDSDYFAFWYQRESGPEFETVFVIHDFSVSLVESGAKVSSALNKFLSGEEPDQYVNELRATQGVKSVTLSGGDKYSYIQGDAPTDRVSFITRVFIAGDGEGIEDMYRYFVVDGARLPTDTVTALSDAVSEWTFENNIFTETVSEEDIWYFSGIMICPYNDDTVFVKFEPTEGSKKTLSNPVFWTQPGGSNAEFWNNLALEDAAAFQVYHDTGDSADLESELWSNEDVCYSFASTAVVGDMGVWEVPVAAGQKLFFTVRASWTVVDDDGNETPEHLVYASDNNGITLWVDGALPSHVDISDMLTAYDLTATAVVALPDETVELEAFYYDHFPTGEEFPEEERELIDEYEIGICGSFRHVGDGIYEPQEWQQHPYDCTDQLGGDKCMFCKGRANDQVRSVCLDRLGNTCNGAFNSVPRYAFCNLEFECPASTISFSLFLALSLLSLLFFAL